MGTGKRISVKRTLASATVAAGENFIAHIAIVGSYNGSSTLSKRFDLLCNREQGRGRYALPPSLLVGRCVITLS